MENNRGCQKRTLFLNTYESWKPLVLAIYLHVLSVTQLYPTLLRLHGLQPTRLLCSWNFPSKNTGVGCHFPTPGDLPDPGIKPASLASPALAGRFFTTSATWKSYEKPTRFHHSWDFPGKNTGVGCHFLLQEIFLTQGLNPGLPHYRQTLYCLSHQGSIYYIVKYNILIILIFNVQKLLLGTEF